jgi:hypothetical protein
MIAQETQNLDITEERRQFEQTKACAVSAIQARVGSAPQPVTTDRQQTIDLSVRQPCFHLGSSHVLRKKRPSPSVPIKIVPSAVSVRALAPPMELDRSSGIGFMRLATSQRKCRNKQQ